MKIFPDSAGKRSTSVFLLVFAIAFISRFYLEQRVKTCLDGDESAVGVMAFHIQDRGEHPLFLYGQHHGGGHSVAAHLAAFINSIFGRKTIHLRLSSLLGFAIFSGLSFLAAERALGSGAAVLVALHLILSPYMYRPSMRVNGYMETLALSMLCAHIFFSRMVCGGGDGGPARSKPPGAHYGLALGLLSGVAFWLCEFSAVMTFALFAVYVFTWRKKALPAAAAWALSFPLGAFAIVYDNFASGFINFGHLLHGTGVGAKATNMPLAGFFTRELPSFLQFNNMGYLPPEISWTAWLLYAAAVLAFGSAAWLFFFRRNELSPVAKFSFCFIPFYCVVYILSPFRGESARYLLPIEPFLTITCACGAAFLIKTRRPGFYFLAAFIVCAAVFADFQGTSAALKDSVVDDGYATDVSCAELDDLMVFLQETKVTHVYTKRFLRWMIIYNTQERVKAADINLIPDAVAWTEYEDAVADSAHQTFVFNKSDSGVQWLFTYLRHYRIPFRVRRNGHYALIKPERKISSEHFTRWSENAYEFGK